MNYPDDSKPARKKSDPGGSVVKNDPSQDQSTSYGVESKDGFMRSGETRTEREGALEVETTPELEPAVLDWVEKVEGKDAKLDDPVTDDLTGQVVVSDSDYLPDDAVILPLTEEEVREGLHHKVYDSLRWMAEWCVMMIKKAGKRVVYKQK